MPLADTGRAIGEVVELLVSELGARTTFNVSVGHPEPSSGTAEATGERLNVFLFEAEFDASMRNLSVYEGQPPQLWLALRFLLTAFDENNRSDTIEAHRILGQGLAALQELGYLDIRGVLPETEVALEDNPERIKITFLDASSDLLAKLLQGSEERYRFSMAFELRPVMVATAGRTDYTLLVGVDYSVMPERMIGEDGIAIDVQGTIGLRLASVEPAVGAVGDTLLLRGQNLVTTDVVARLATIELPVASADGGGLAVILDAGSVHGGAVSAGQHPLQLVRTLDSGRTRSSNMVIFELLPVLSRGTNAAMVVSNPTDPDPLLEGTFDIEGNLLGTDADDVFVALYADGRAVQLFDTTEDSSPGDSPQTVRTVTIPTAHAVPPGTYRVILSVNNVQARQSPEIVLSAP